MRKTEEDQGVRLMRMTTGVLLGGVISLAVCIAVLFLCSIGICNGWIPERLMGQYTVIGCALGGLIGGGVAVRRCGSGPLLAGLAAGAVLFLLLLTVGVLLLHNTSIENGGAGLLCGALGGGAISGLLGARPKKKRRKK
jgi:putative membrane protein (TIGR04086 family)